VIPQDFISEWKKAAPWSQNDQVEQDLIICRALVEIFSSSMLEVAGAALERMTPEGGETCVRVEWICDLPTEAFSKNIRDVALQTPVEISKR